MMKYYVNLTPPKDIFERVKKIERQWQGDSASDPHLTLISPRYLQPGRTEDELEQALFDLASAPGRFICMVSLTEVDYFDKKKHIYIRVQNTPSLEHLQERIRQKTVYLLAPPEIEVAGPWQPHITLASHLTPERGAEAWETLKNENFTGTFPCTEFSLLRKGPEDKRWEVLRTFETA